MALYLIQINGLDWIGFASTKQVRNIVVEIEILICVCC